MTGLKDTNDWRVKIYNTDFIENQGMLNGQAICNYGERKAL